MGLLRLTTHVLLCRFSTHQGADGRWVVNKPHGGEEYLEVAGSGQEYLEVAGSNEGDVDAYPTRGRTNTVWRTLASSQHSELIDSPFCTPYFPNIFFWGEGGFIGHANGSLMVKPHLL